MPTRTQQRSTRTWRGGGEYDAHGEERSFRISSWLGRRHLRRKTIRYRPYRPNADGSAAIVPRQTRRSGEWARTDRERFATHVEYVIGLTLVPSYSLYIAQNLF